MTKFKKTAFIEAITATPLNNETTKIPNFPLVFHQQIEGNEYYKTYKINAEFGYIHTVHSDINSAINGVEMATNQAKKALANAVYGEIRDEIINHMDAIHSLRRRQDDVCEVADMVIKILDMITPD